ncbi:MAG TPA: hypothetical protein VFO01_11480 [Trebonia sp.]|nr:hypothetical protein [Trebonia sp.]
MAGNHTISRPVPRDPADEYVHDKLFRMDRRYGGLDVDTGRISGSHVVQVTDDGGIQWTQAAELAGAQFAGLAGGDVAMMARSALVRSTLRPVSGGGGRPRFR